MGALSVVMGALCSAGQEPEPFVDAKGKAAVQERARGDWVDYGVLGGIKLDEEEQKKVDKIKIDNLKYLNTPEHAEDKKVIEKIYADCGAKDVYGGALDIAHFKTKFPKQGQHLFDRFDVDHDGNVSQAEFLAVIDKMYQDYATKAAKFVKFLDIKTFNFEK